MNKYTKKIYWISLFMIASCSNDRSGQFENEYNRINDSINCLKTKISPADEFSGALYSCVGGSGETVKVFINEDNGKVKNIKFIIAVP